MNGLPNFERRALAAAALTLAIAAFAARPAAAQAEPTRHHLGIGFGYAKFVSDDLDDSGFEDSGLGMFAYRYSVSPNVDVVLDSRGTVSSQDGTFDLLGTPVYTDIHYGTAWFGPGVRYNFKPAGTRPYVQGNVYVASEGINLHAFGLDISDSETGIGFGLQAGIDIRLSKLLSLPVEMNFMSGKPENDLTCVGGNVGLTFNFGKMP
jgi:hypothetical protein